MQQASWTIGRNGITNNVTYKADIDIHNVYKCFFILYIYKKRNVMRGTFPFNLPFEHISTFCLAISDIFAAIDQI